MKLIFNNSFMTLCVNSMGKLHEVEALHDSDCMRKNGFVEVASLNGLPVMAKQYPATTTPSLFNGGDLNSSFFIRADKKYFEVLLITKCQDAANAIMLKDDSAALIATDNEGRHYIASTAPSTH
jgi:hypothetical protein